MKKSVIIVSMALVSIASHVNAQFVTIDPAHIATSIINTASEIVQTSSTVSNVINNWKEVERVIFASGRHLTVLLCMCRVLLPILCEKRTIHWSVCRAK